MSRRIGGPSDDGAIAVMVALLVFVLVLLAAFATDFGMAFTSKRNLQNAADSAALAAAQTFATGTGDCATLRSALSASAQSTADTFAQQNVLSFAKNWQRNEWSVLCPGDPGRANATDNGLEVVYGNQASTSTIFGALAGASSITTGRRAIASVFVPDAIKGLRPYVICLNDALTVLQANPTSVEPIYFPNCEETKPAPGNWYPIECPPPDDGNSNGQLATNTRNGCSSEVRIVDTSAANGNPAQIRNLLINACSTVGKTSDGKKGCLVSDQANNMTSKAVRDAWDSLLGKVIVLPVVDAGSPPGDPLTTTITGQGSNAKFPVKAMVAVRVCGYSWQSKTAEGITNTGDCAGASFVANPTAPDYLLLRFSKFIVNGSSGGSICTLGDPTCDLNSVRGIALVK